MPEERDAHGSPDNLGRRVVRDHRRDVHGQQRLMQGCVGLPGIHDHCSGRLATVKRLQRGKRDPRMRDDGRAQAPDRGIRKGQEVALVAGNDPRAWRHGAQDVRHAFALQRFGHRDQDLHRPPSSRAGIPAHCRRLRVPA